MSEVIKSVEQVTPAWLDGVLRRAGALDRGEVVRVEAAAARSLLISNVCRLEAVYSDGADEASPRRLFLKWSKPSLEARSSRNEVEFYNSVARDAPGPPLIRCYDAAFDEETGASHLLLEDLSETHTQTVSPLPPAVKDCELAVECLAQFHARWWEHPRLGADVGRLTTAEEYEELGRLLEKHLAGFLDFLGDRLPAKRRAIYRKVLAGSMYPWRRMLRREGLTVSHGDAHWWNFLYPRGGTAGGARVFDWHLWHVDVPTKDLAYMIALNWYPSRRAALEERLLRRYHAGLVAGGVGGYGWEDCWLEYRRMVVRELFVPVWQWSSGMQPGVWWPGLERIWMAFEDLGCEEFLET